MTADDRGSIALCALFVVVIGSTSIAALTSLNLAVLDAHKAQVELEELQHMADSALSIASSRMRSLGSSSSTSCPSHPDQIVDVDVVVTCAREEPVVASRPAGFVATLNSSTANSNSLPAWAGPIEDAIRGAVVINTGTLSTPAVSYLPDRQARPVGSGGPTWEPLSTPWSTFAATDDPDEAAEYPPLPPLPTFERPGAQAVLGTCHVYFPGRYLGTTALTLSGGSHYFTSGVYYFERGLTISSGARVVMGAGRHVGCSDDSEASFNSRAPRDHAIDPAGAVLLLGSSARLVVQESSLAINLRRDGISVRTVGFGTSSTAVVVPPDYVRTADGSTVAASSHSVVPVGSSTAYAYKSSTLAPSTAFAVDVRLNGAVPDSNRVVIDGRVFVPHAGIRFSSTSAGYRIALTGGIVASRLTTSLATAPTGVGSGFSLGVEPSDAAPSTKSIDVEVRRGRRSVSSRAVFDTQQNWQVVARSRSRRAIPPT